MSVFDTPFDPYAQAAARRAQDVERWVSQRTYERAARAAVVGSPAPVTQRQRWHRAKPVTRFGWHAAR